MKGGTLRLRLGLTDYKAFLGTNMNPVFRDVRDRRYFADPLGVNAVLMTSDRKIVMIRRSRHVATSQGLLDMPGGHAEPSRVKGVSSEEDEIVSDDIVEEIFRAIRLEIRDECGVPLSNLRDQSAFCVLRVNGAEGNANVCFRIRTDLSSEEIRELYEKGGMSEAFESTDIVFLDVDSIRDASRRKDWTHTSEKTISVWFEGDFEKE